MIILPGHSKEVLSAGPSNTRHSERGAALAIALLMMILLSAIALGVLAVVQGEAKIAGSDLKRTEACYASAAAIEIMTNNFSALFSHTSRPTTAELKEISDTPPPALTNPPDATNVAYIFPDHEIEALATPSPSPKPPPKTIPNGPFAGLIAGLTSYRLTTTAKSTMAQCKLTREMNNYLIPLFQFGMFSDKDIELHPGPDFTFNGRVHANGNIYVNGSVRFLDKVTAANELVYDVLRNGSTRSGATVSMEVGTFNVKLNKGSVKNGPHLLAAGCAPQLRGCFPGSPSGTDNASWNATSVSAANGGANKFGGQLLTRTTGAAQLKLPLQLDGSPTRELIKRRVTNDNPVPAEPSALSLSRYHTKSRIRILIDDEVPNLADTSGIPAGQGLALSTFDPSPLPNNAISPLVVANGGGRALWRINDNNTGFSNSYSVSGVTQQQNGAVARQAETVRGVKPSVAKVITGATNANPISITCTAHGYNTGNTVVIKDVLGNTNANGSYTITVVNANTFTLDGRAGNAGYTGNTGIAYRFADIPTSALGTAIPAGAGITGRILIQIVDADGNEFDVTRQILSMGVTQGEPNSIIQLQRPLWAAFTQGSRAADGGADNLADIVNSNVTSIGATGEIRIDGTHPDGNANGYITDIVEENTVLTALQRQDTPPTNSMATLMTYPGVNWANWNAIVPINVYNMREGHLQTSVGQDAVYERGITNVVEVNMRNLARWIDGVYDQNLLAGTNAISGNIGHNDGYTVYISDRRGDNVRSMTVANPGSKPVTYSTFDASNGMVDNVDIYGLNGTMDPGEDVQNKGLTVGAALGSATVAPFLKDITELPDPAVLNIAPDSYAANDYRRAIAVAAWANLDLPANPTNHRYFRSAVRLFNGENLQVTNSVARRLSTTHGITVATENMVYIWGNYNTTGINEGPDAGESSLNESTAESHYCPGPGSGSACASVIDTQVPASIVADAFFPMSKTWFDSSSALYPDDYERRRADRNMSGGNAGDKQGTSVRAGIIAGNNLAALDGTPDADNGNDSRLNGGVHNFPRFLEDWLSDDQRWNFVGSFVPLYNSTQAMGQWWYITGDSAVYGAPERNWAFDATFLEMDRLPPGTPMFQYLSPSAFRQVL